MTLAEDLKKPFNVITTLISVLSISLGIFFYINSKKTKSISYQITEPTSLIYDKQNASSAIKVLEKDSIPVTDNVYLLTGTILNSGDLPISNDDVRKSISLNLPKAKKILDFKIIKQIDPEVAKFNLVKMNDQSLVLQWKYFDPNYMCKFQIIYSGMQDPQFNLTGKILDVVSFDKKSDSPNILYSIILGVIGMVGGFLTGNVFGVLKYNKENAVRKPIVHLIMLIIILLATSIYIFLVIHQNPLLKKP